MSLLQKIDFTKKIRARIIKMAQDDGDVEEAERLGGKTGTGHESYPGTDNLNLFSKLLAADYGINATVCYVSSEAAVFPMQYEPSGVNLPVAFAVNWSQSGGIHHFDLLQSWIKPIPPVVNVQESFALDQIHKRKLIPGAGENNASYAAKWSATKAALSLFTGYKQIKAEDDQSIIASVTQWQKTVAKSIPEFEHSDGWPFQSRTDDDDRRQKTMCVGTVGVSHQVV
jgi:hypothetical protein